MVVNRVFFLEKEFMMEKEMELVIAQPVIVDGKLRVESNVPTLKEQLASYIEGYKALELTEDNTLKIEMAKKKVRELRITVDKRYKEYKTLYINPTLDELQLQIKEVQNYIAEVEGHIDSLLAKQDEARIARLNFMYDEYNKEAEEEYGVTYIAPRGKEFYLKGAAKKQEELRQKIFDAVRLYKEEKEAKEKDKQLVIERAAELSVSHEAYVAMLEYKSVTDVLFLMAAHKKEAEQKAAEQKAAEQKAAEPKEEQKKYECPKTVKVENSNVGSKNSDQDELRQLCVKLTYKKSQRELMHAFFKENGITVEIIH